MKESLEDANMKKSIIQKKINPLGFIVFSFLMLSAPIVWFDKNDKEINMAYIFSFLGFVFILFLFLRTYKSQRNAVLYYRVIKRIKKQKGKVNVNVLKEEFIIQKSWIKNNQDIVWDDVESYDYSDRESCFSSFRDRTEEITEEEEILKV